jgi:hypothetical protein
MLSIAFETYGIKLMNFEIPIFTKELIELIIPFQNITLKTVNFITSNIWNKINNKYKISSPININLDNEFLDFAKYDTIFDNTKIKSLGFKLKYPKFADGWKETIDWYEKNNWIPYHTKNNNYLKGSISFYENMYGKYIKDSQEKKFNFSCNVLIPSIEEFSTDFTSFIEGHVDTDIEDISDNRLKGKLIIDLIKRKKLIYDFNFSDNYRFYGIKNINYMNFIYSITHLEGIIYKNGNFFAEAKLIFDLKELKSFIESFKFSL